MTEYFFAVILVVTIVGLMFMFIKSNGQVATVNAVVEDNYIDHQNGYWEENYVGEDDHTIYKLKQLNAEMGRIVDDFAARAFCESELLIHSVNFANYNWARIAHDIIVNNRVSENGGFHPNEEAALELFDDLFKRLYPVYDKDIIELYRDSIDFS